VVGNNLKVPVIDHWWQTETGWAIAANCMGLHQFPVKYGSPTKAVPGWDLQVVDANNQPVAPGEIGALVVKLPLPPGTLPTLYKTMTDSSNPIWKNFRDTTKPPMPVISTKTATPTSWPAPTTSSTWPGIACPPAPWRKVLADHPDVAECAVLGVEDKLKGQIPIGFLVLNAGVDRDHTEIQQEVVQMVRDRIGPVAAFKTATVVNRLPKTRSGKILRGTIQKIADNKAYKVPATIDDPTILGEMKAALNGIGRRPLQGKCMLIQNADGTVAIVNPEPEYGEIFHVKGGQLPEAVQCHRAIMFPDDGVVCHDDFPPSTRSVV
jgi:propionyl-CoA synthetase